MAAALTRLLVIVFLVFSPGAAFSADTLSLTVQKGDSLSAICAEYLGNAALWRKIAALNKLDNPHFILPGQRLEVPAHLVSGLPLEGTVSLVRGVAEAQAPGESDWQPLREGTPLREGSLIRTGEESSLEITYGDETTLLLRPETTMTVAKARRKGARFFLYDLYLKAGRAISELRRATGKELRYEIRTPSAVAAARGTDFRVAVEPGGDTRCEVLAGKVGVRSGKGARTVTEGKGTVVREGQAPLAPLPLPAPPVPAELLPLYRSMPLIFKLTTGAGAVGYRAMLFRDREGRDLVKERLLAAGDVFEVAGVDDGVYYLLANSVSPLGLEGPSSAPETVSVRVNPLPPFIQEPRSDAVIKGETISLRWLKVEDAARYHLQVASDPGFSSLVLESDTLTETGHRTGNLAYGVYFFRLASIAGDGYEGVWSDPQRFELVPPPPVPPVEPPEAEGGVMRLRWRNLGAGYSYHAQMSDTPDFKELLLDTRTTEPEISFERPKKDGTYYVRTSAVDRDGFEGAFSPPQSFEVSVGSFLAAGAWLAALLLMIAL